MWSSQYHGMGHGAVKTFCTALKLLKAALRWGLVVLGEFIAVLITVRLCLKSGAKERGNAKEQSFVWGAAFRYIPGLKRSNEENKRSDAYCSHLHVHPDIMVKIDHYSNQCHGCNPYESGHCYVHFRLTNQVFKMELQSHYWLNALQVYCMRSDQFLLCPAWRAYIYIRVSYKWPPHWPSISQDL